MTDPQPCTSVSQSSAAPRSPEPADPDRLTVAKTYKIYVNGAFSRSESGRTYLLAAANGDPIANVCRCSRKDVRDAVVAARAAFPAWSGISAYLRGQVLYRVAEMLEGRAEQFAAELARQGLTDAEARDEVRAAVDRLVYYAGWTDKIQQVFGSVNPVSSSHFSFSLLEPAGVVALVAPEASGLLGLVSTLAPILAGGNTCVALASYRRPLSAVTLGEVLQTSDVPAGVANFLTGRRDELTPPLASHLDVNAVVYPGEDADAVRTLREDAADNVKRVCLRRATDWFADAAQGPYVMLDTMETKTTWHPMGG